MVAKKWFKNFGLKIKFKSIQTNQSKIQTPSSKYILIVVQYIHLIIKLILKRFNEVKWVNLYICIKNIFELKFAMLKSILTVFYYLTYIPKKEWNLFLDPILQQI